MTEPAFIGAGKTPGFELWRIEKFSPVKQPNVNGKFYTGDSYILLATIQKVRGGPLSWNIHFWLGAETTHDEAGTAARKAVELDDSLGGGPVQYREVQGFESPQFLSYFKNNGGIEYLAGGVESGFRKVERDVYPTRLLHLKGKRTVRVTEVPVAASSLTSDDVFILDKGLKIFIFNGPTANKFEKSKGIEVATRIKGDERGGRAEIVLLDVDPRNAEFWGSFGGYHDPKCLPSGDRDSLEETKSLPRKLYKISDESGLMSFVDVTPANGRLTKSALDTNDVFLVQSPTGKFYLWIGKKSNINEKREATILTVQYLTEHGLPQSSQIERVSEGAETGGFKAEFAIWDSPQNFNQLKSAGTAAKLADTPIDVAQLLARQAAEEAPVDDGSGKLQVWVVKNAAKAPVDANDYGEFFGGDSYVLLYTYKKGRAEEYIIYFWLGNESTADEKGYAALLTKELDDSLGGKPVQVRVTQGKEPAHFRQLFRGKMIIYKGGLASGFAKTKESAEQEDVALFHVKGTTTLNTAAVQVNATAASLNSQDSFLLVTPSHVYTWYGVGSNAAERSVSANFATILAGKYKGTGGRVVVEVDEGSENEDFWSALGGKVDYPATAPGDIPPRDARLFHASTATGRFRVEPVDNYDQSDLNDEDVFLLDTYTQLFVWIGSQSTEEEKAKALDFAAQYIREVDDGRDADIPIIRVHAGQEPAMFSSHFLAWDSEYTSKRVFKDPYQAKLDALAAEKAKKAAAQTPAPAAAPTPAPAPKAAPVAAKKGEFSYEVLRESLPDGVDPTQKEEYLDDATFAQVFGMDRVAFRALPKWKRDEAKKKKGLF